MVYIEDCNCEQNCGWNAKEVNTPLTNPILLKEFVGVDGRPHLPITCISFKSRRKIKWQCELKHPIWITSIASRIQYEKISPCPYCANTLLLEGFNDLLSTDPEIASYWDYEKNTTTPNQYTVVSGTHVYWKCEQNHSWTARIADRVRYQTGCPYCSNRKTLPGVNDFTISYPHLVSEWDYDKNTHPPEQYSAGNKKKFHWKHFHQKTQTWHCWEASLLNRTKDGSICIYCSNYKSFPGLNDLETLAPEIAAQWDYSKNSTYPSEHLHGSHFLAWWNCDKGHSWKTSIKARCSGSGCGKCRLVSTSKIEQAFHAVFSGMLNTINQSYTDKIIIGDKKYQIDIFGTLNEEKVAIEYDGKYYHADKQTRDIEKTKILLNDGYRVVRIREDYLPFLDFKHRDFFQFSFDYSLDKTDILNLVEKIIFTLRTENE